MEWLVILKEIKLALRTSFTSNLQGIIIVTLYSNWLTKFVNCKCNIISKLSLCNVYIYLHKTIKYECCGILLNQFSPSSNYIYLGRYLQLQSTSLSFCLHWLASIKNLAKQTNSYEFFGGESMPLWALPTPRGIYFLSLSHTLCESE